MTSLPAAAALPRATPDAGAHPFSFEVSIRYQPRSWVMLGMVLLAAAALASLLFISSLGADEPAHAPAPAPAAAAAR